MANKITQLNDFPSKKVFTQKDGCGYEEEVPGEGTDLELQDLKSRVKNYKTFMLNKYGVPEEELFNVVVFDIKNVQALLSRNKTATGLRVYLSKNSSDPNVLDYEIIVVPTKDAVDQYGNRYFLDMLNPGDPDANLFISYCRRPPGCPDNGALLG
jgi:hypothetical protein